MEEFHNRFHSADKLAEFQIAIFRPKELFQKPNLYRSNDLAFLIIENFINYILLYTYLSIVYSKSSFFGTKFTYLWHNHWFETFSNRVCSWVCLSNSLNFTCEDVLFPHLKFDTTVFMGQLLLLTGRIAWS